MPVMRGLTILIATADPERGRAALTLACAQVALGGRTRLYCHEAAVALLVAGSDPGDEALAAHGLPPRAALLEAARESGVELIACQTGLALAGIAHSELIAGAEAGGLIGLLASLEDDRLVTF